MIWGQQGASNAYEDHEPKKEVKYSVQNNLNINLIYYISIKTEIWHHFKMDGRKQSGWNWLDIFLTILLVEMTLVTKGGYMTPDSSSSSSKM